MGSENINIVPGTLSSLKKLAYRVRGSKVSRSLVKFIGDIKRYKEDKIAQHSSETGALSSHQKSLAIDNAFK